MKITLSKIYRTTKTKDGKPLTTKDGRNYERLSVKCQEYGEQWLSGFGSNWNTMWAEGDTVEVEIKKVNKDGKEYLNFERIDKLSELENRIKALEDMLLNKKSTTIPADDVDPEDIPF
jgi:hypothetical protein